MGDRISTGESQQQSASPSQNCAHRCFGGFARSKFVTLCLIDVLIVSNAIIFTAINVSDTEEKYLDRNGILIAIILPYIILLPALFIETIWLCTCVLALLSSRKTVMLPYLCLPHILATPLLIAADVMLTVRLIDCIMHNIQPFWSIGLLAFLCAAFFIEQSYFLYVKMSTMKMLMRKRKLVSATERTQTSGVAALKQNTAGVECQYDTYSTQSTVVVDSDENLNRPSTT